MGQLENLKQNPQKWILTGCAGFIGSHLLEELLFHNQIVVGIDNFSTGFQKNLEAVRAQVSEEQWKAFHLIEGDICEASVFDQIQIQPKYFLHHAAFVSVPLSIKEPFQTFNVNTLGFLNVLNYCAQNKIDSLVYASSSAVYGDDDASLKIEDQVGRCLSPYAVSKYDNELWAHQFSLYRQIRTVGLRYFNIFGPRQDPNSPYSAVIPKWINAILNQNQPLVFGDGSATRDYCYVKDVVQANLRAALQEAQGSSVYNVGRGQAVSLLELYDAFAAFFKAQGKTIPDKSFEPERPGDILHSCASIQKIKSELHFQPSPDFNKNLHQTIEWEIQNAKS